MKSLIYEKISLQQQAEHCIQNGRKQTEETPLSLVREPIFSGQNSTWCFMPSQPLPLYQGKLDKTTWYKWLQLIRGYNNGKLKDRVNSVQAKVKVFWTRVKNCENYLLHNEERLKINKKMTQYV